VDAVSSERVDTSSEFSYERLDENRRQPSDQQVIFRLVASLWSQMTAFSRRNFTSSGTEFMTVFWTVIPAPITWYIGAAQNPSAFEIGTVQRMTLDPN
jgi:hypothetical protein